MGILGNIHDSDTPKHPKSRPQPASPLGRPWAAFSFPHLFTSVVMLTLSPDHRWQGNDRPLRRPDTRGSQRSMGVDHQRPGKVKLTMTAAITANFGVPQPEDLYPQPSDAVPIGSSPIRHFPVMDTAPNSHTARPPRCEGVPGREGPGRRPGIAGRPMERTGPLPASRSAQCGVLQRIELHHALIHRHARQQVPHDPARVAPLFHIHPRIGAQHVDPLLDPLIQRP